MFKSIPFDKKYRYKSFLVKFKLTWLGLYCYNIGSLYCLCVMVLPPVPEKPIFSVAFPSVVLIFMIEIYNGPVTVPYPFNTLGMSKAYQGVTVPSTSQPRYLLWECIWFPALSLVHVTSFCCWIPQFLVLP